MFNLLGRLGHIKGEISLLFLFFLLKIINTSRYTQFARVSIETGIREIFFLGFAHELKLFEKDLQCNLQVFLAASLETNITYFNG